MDDEVFICENLQRVLSADGYTVFITHSGEDALDIVVEEEIDLVLLDLNLGSTSGLDVLKALKDIDPELLVIIITGYGTVESAVESLKMGAYDYIKKPFKADAIHLIVRLALETQELRREVRHLKRGSEALASAMQIVGASEEMKRIYSQIQEVAKHEAATVLITGESGTGKELVAKAIHNLSPRSAKPFVEINCGSLPYNLLESELFRLREGSLHRCENPQDRPSGRGFRRHAFSG
ncbi:MAG: response regulator [Geovibrio sp.]|nr:response regulator [Geovibrio sp.]